MALNSVGRSENRVRPAAPWATARRTRLAPVPAPMYRSSAFIPRCIPAAIPIGLPNVFASRCTVCNFCFRNRCANAGTGVDGSCGFVVTTTGTCTTPTWSPPSATTTATSKAHDSNDSTNGFILSGSDWTQPTTSPDCPIRQSPYLEERRAPPRATGDPEFLLRTYKPHPSHCGGAHEVRHVSSPDTGCVIQEPAKARAPVGSISDVARASVMVIGLDYAWRFVTGV